MKNISERALNIVNIIKEKGYLAYIVGGAVRDALLGNNPIDYDITTSALPEEIIDIFSFAKILTTGLKHGTVTVILNDVFYEITTFRSEDLYLDNRHPNNVSFINSLKKDCERRDFTINAICYDGELIDYYNGIEDLHHKLIRCVGNPFERFEEDALRIIRALRFSSTLDFEIEDKTKEAIHAKKDLLKKISIERINKELFQMFKYDCNYIIDEYFDVFEVIFPHIKNNKKEILNKFLYLNDETLKYCSFFSCCGKEEFEDIIKKYHLSNDICKLIKLLNFEQIDLYEDKIILKKILKNYNYNDIINYIEYKVLSDDKKNRLSLLLDEANKECHNLSMLKVNGNDLISIGITEGKQIKLVLNLLIDSVIEGKVNNTKIELLNYANNTIKI